MVKLESRHGGFRRGTDIFKALALGANAIAIGRLISGVSARSASRVSRRSSTFSAPGSRWSCARPERPPSTRSQKTTSWIRGHTSSAGRKR